MPLTLSARAEAKLNTVAQHRGVDPSALIEQILDEQFPTIEEDAVPDLTDRDWTERKAPLLVRSPARAVEYLSARLQAEATDDPEEIRNAQAELDEMKETLNAERLRAGAAPIF